MMNEYQKFNKGFWNEEINVSDFIKNNYKEYKGNENFLKGITQKTDKVWSKCERLLKEELEKKVLDIDVDNMSGINAFESGYIDKSNK